MNLGFTPPVSMDETEDFQEETLDFPELWRNGLADAKEAALILRNDKKDKVKQGMPWRWLYHLSRQVHDTEFFEIFGVNREAWLTELQKQYKFTETAPKLPGDEKPVPSYLEALIAIFEFNGNKEELFWVCRCYPEFLPYVYSYLKNVFNELDYKQLALFNTQARESILHFNGLGNIARLIARRLGSYSTLKREESKKTITVEDFNWQWASTYIENVCAQSNLQQPDLINNLVYIAVTFNKLALVIYERPELAQYVKQFSVKQHKDILCKNLILEKYFKKHKMLTEKYFGLDYLLEILNTHPRLATELLLSLTDNDKDFLMRLCLKSAQITQMLFTHDELDNLFTFITEADFLKLCLVHPACAQHFFNNKTYTQYIYGLDVELLKIICEQCPNVYSLLSENTRFLEKFIKVAKIVDPEKCVTDEPREEKCEVDEIKHVADPIAPGDTFYPFNQEILGKLFVNHVEQRGNCAGLSFDFLRWCRKHPEKDYQHYSKKLQKLKIHGKKVLDHSNWVHRIHFFQLNQAVYEKNCINRVVLEEINHKAFAALIEKILQDLKTHSYLYLHVGDHAIALARHPHTGRITVFDANSEISTYDVPSDLDDLICSLEVILDSASVLCEKLKVYICPVTEALVQKPLPLTRQEDKSAGQVLETKQTAATPVRYEDTPIVDLVIKEIAIKNYAKAWELLGILEKILQGKESCPEAKTCRFLQKIIITIKLDLGIAYGNLQQGIPVDINFQDPETGDTLLHRAEKAEYPNPEIITLLRKAGADFKVNNLNQQESKQLAACSPQKTMQAPLPVLSPNAGISRKRKAETQSTEAQMDTGIPETSKRPRLS